MTRTLAELDAKVDHLAQLVGANLGIDTRTSDEKEQAEKDAAKAEKDAQNAADA